MTVKTILTPLIALPQARTALDTAFVVGRRFGSHVVGLYARPAFREENVEVIMKLGSLGRHSPLLQEVSPVSLEDDDTERARRLFETACRDMQVRLHDQPHDLPGVSGAFKVIIGDEPEAFAAQARVFDLVVASQPKNDPGHVLREVLRSILFHSGRPVLVAPDRTPASVGNSILIAWNRGPISARAAAISRRYFERAERVSILSVDMEHGQGPPAEDLKEYLAWHGIAAELVEAKAGSRRLGDVILDKANAIGADLLVMGAYSQSPFRESLTRGVTNHILSHAELPVLMTH